MIVDKYSEFLDATAVNSAAGSALVGNVIDLGANPADYGVVEDLYLVIQTDVAVITAGAAGTIEFKLQSDAQAAITPASATTHFSTGTLVTDGIDANDDRLKIGGRICAVKLPSGTYERYLGITVTTATTTTTAGSVSAFLTPNINAWKAYPDAVN